MAARHNQDDSPDWGPPADRDLQETVRYFDRGYPNEPHRGRRFYNEPYYHRHYEEEYGPYGPRLYGEPGHSAWHQYFNRANYYDEPYFYYSEPYFGRYGPGGPYYGESRQPARHPRGHWHGRTIPRTYHRSDEDIQADICDRLIDHPGIDTSDLQVRVQQGEVTLSGTVDDRREKHLAEIAAETVAGVREVHNQLRVSRSQQAGAVSRAGRG